MFFKKLKEENKSLEKKVFKLKAELSDAQASMAEMRKLLADAQASMAEMRKLLADEHAKHTEADVAQAIRSAIVRRCEKIGAGSTVNWCGMIESTEPKAAEILHLVEAYNKLNNAHYIDMKQLVGHEVTIDMIRPVDEGAAHD